jgi:alpha-beta hydrolase superfamily lysophospholipase
MGVVGRSLRRLVKYVLLAVIAVVVLVPVGWGLLSRRFADLRPWHTIAPSGEFSASDLRPDTTLAQYLAREAAAMQEVSEKVAHGFTPGPGDALQRYTPGSPVNPSGFAVNWNRTFELTPEAPVGAALLIHGMTDSPYSMRTLARTLSEAGYYCLALRMPGHGTVPAGLAESSWQDWAAAVRVGVRHARGRIGDGKPLILVGYSNGGALVLDYTLDALADTSLVRPDRLVLVSPMIGVARAAGLSDLISLLHGVPVFEKAAWTSVAPEYNPFKYNSFPASAASASYRLTRSLDRKIADAVTSGRINSLPPVLTFQSVVDATVATGAVVTVLYDRLPANGSELVMFGVDRSKGVQTFMPPHFEQLSRSLLSGATRKYGLSYVTNITDTTAEVGEWRMEPGHGQPAVRSLGLSWPLGVFSLSHIALPFPPDDPLYGMQPRTDENFGLRLGALSARGERGVLVVSGDDMMRLSSNPFFPYLQDRLRAWIEAPFSAR